MLVSNNYLLSDVDMGEEEAQAVAEVVRSKWLSVGPRTAEFEKQFAEKMGVGYAVAVSSCTAALHLGLQASGVGPGDEVLVPSYTFVASGNAIVYTGATPVFVEINGAKDLNLDIDDLESKITDRTKAILPVHMAGFPADMDRIMALAEKHGLSVVEDACHAIGTTYAGGPGSSFRGRKAGTIGTAGCFSFFANKNLVTGEGGMLVTDNEEFATKVRMARSHGMSKSSWDKAEDRAMDYDVVGLGYNYRSTELTAALGLIQLRKLDGANNRRRELAAHYRKQLDGATGITLPFSDRLEDSSHHIFPVVLDSNIDRPAFRESLKEKGIQTSVHYPPVHEFSFYRNTVLKSPCTLPITEDIAGREVTLPLHPLLSEDDVEIISAAVLETLSELA